VTHPPKGSAAPAEQDAQPDPAVHYVSAKEVVAATGLPIYLFRDCAERERKRIPHLMLVGNRLQGSWCESRMILESMRWTCKRES